MNTQDPVSASALRSFPEFLTTEEVAEILKVTPQTIGNYIRSGDLPAYRIGRSHRIARKELQSFLLENRETRNAALESPYAALLLRQTSGAKLVLRTTAEYLHKHLTPDQQTGIAIAFNGKEYSLSEFVSLRSGAWKKRTLQS